MFAEEVEEVLKQHPGIADAAVLGVSDERLGRKVVALLRAGERPPSEEELHTHARAHLAGYKVPKHMAFVDSLERADNGKLDHRRLTGIAESKWGTATPDPDRQPRPAPPPSAFVTGRGKQSARTGTIPRTTAGLQDGHGRRTAPRTTAPAHAGHPLWPGLKSVRPSSTKRHPMTIEDPSAPQTAGPSGRHRPAARAACAVPRRSTHGGPADSAPGSTSRDGPATSTPRPTAGPARPRRGPAARPVHTGEPGDRGDRVDPGQE
ncbi:hypothetical protein WJ438_37595 [Streptomyces sp. GD-15H]|uniref:AMP-binding enzyme n=1 Tax=Streptomyces sp. GD-15H TaxID=3129112 RepID=UPI003252CAE6